MHRAMRSHLGTSVSSYGKAQSTVPPAASTGKGNPLQWFPDPASISKTFSRIICFRGLTRITKLNKYASVKVVHYC